MCATICNPLTRNPAIHNPVNHYKLACIRPECGLRAADSGQPQPAWRKKGRAGCAAAPLKAQRGARART
eukprot:13587263-Alexandrium_andersonii.AAC.1